jgi:peptidylprolyl isomerase
MKTPMIATPPRRQARAVLLALWAFGCKRKRSKGREPASRPARPSAYADSPRESRWISAPPADAQRTSSGLYFVIQKRGAGLEHPTDVDRVNVNYSGFSADGVMFDSSRERAEPGLFTLTQVIPAWNEILKQMVVGEARRLWVPARLAFGDDPFPGLPRGDLLYDIELVKIIRAPRVPEDVAAPPPSATTTRSGLSYRVLKAGHGTTHPRATDTVTVNYSGWTRDGLLFDATSLRNGPAHLALPRLIPGLAEGLLTMLPGETTRFWIPATLAYGDSPANPESPAGMLVFDIELLE